MTKTLFLIFNHQFTPLQAEDAGRSLGVERIETMPEAVREIWGNVPPELAEIREYLAPVREWLDHNAKAGDAVLIQGDFGATCQMVAYARRRGLVPVYSTTRREAVETHQTDGSVQMSHRFLHVRFREYKGDIAT